MVMPLYSSIEKLDRPLLEAAKDLWRQQAADVYPHHHSANHAGIIAGCLLVMLPAMGLFYVSDLMGGAKNLLIGNVIKSQFLNIRDWPFGAATSITLTLVMGLMLLIYWRGALLNKRWSWNDRSTAARRLYDRHLRVSLHPYYYPDR
jgi:spermidine/putrescine transport system permease protein